MIQELNNCLYVLCHYLIVLLIWFKFEVHVVSAHTFAILYSCLMNYVHVDIFSLNIFGAEHKINCRNNNIMSSVLNVSYNFVILSWVLCV